MANRSPDKVSKMSNSWFNVIPIDALENEGTAVVRKGGKQIALFLREGQVLACNNRCPHEGYPLSEGSLDDECVLTCNWHNWKFDLATGENLYRGDRLRTYPAEIRDGDVWLDLTDPPQAERRDSILGSLRSAFDEHDYERLAREVGRWKLADGDPVDIVKQAIRWSYDRFEFGWTHAFAGAADWLRLYDEHHGDLESQLICVLEAVGHMSDDSLREAQYPFSRVRPRPYLEEDFLTAIEEEDEERAIALVRGALSGGLGFPGLEPGLTRAALRHYNDFGHSLIYVNKAGYLIGRLGDEVAESLVVSLVRSLVYASREDLIPEFCDYGEVLECWSNDRSGELPKPSELRRLGIRKALRRTASASGQSPEALFRSLLGANALSMLSYDIENQYRVDGPVSDNVGWLDYTHTITFADAVWSSCRRYPDTWPSGLLQLACFIGRNASFTHRKLNGAQWQVADADQFFTTEVAGLFDHAREEYIVSVHLLKTLLSARALVNSGAAGDSAPSLLGAMNRFLHEPLKRKHVRRTMSQALAFVARDG